MKIGIHTAYMLYNLKEVVQYINDKVNHHGLEAENIFQITPTGIAGEWYILYYWGR